MPDPTTDSDTASANPAASPQGGAPTGGAAIARWLVLIGVSFGVLALGLSWISKRVTIASPVSGFEEEEAAQKPLYPAPDFQLASLDGGTIGPQDYEGDVVLVELWATWCGPCRLQARFLEELHEELDGQGVHFLAVSVGEDEETVREFIEDTPFPYPVLLDPEDTLGQRYQIYGLPTVMIIDRQGNVSFLETGISDTARLKVALKAAGAEIA